MSIIGSHAKGQTNRKNNQDDCKRVQGERRLLANKSFANILFNNIPSECLIFYGQDDCKAGTKIHEEPAASTRDCAQLSVSTDGGTAWTFDTSSKTCSVHNTSLYSTNFMPSEGKISGRRECGLLTQEEWDQKMSSESRANLKKFLQTPRNCTTSQKPLKDEGEVPEEVTKALPAIDVFLNPSRSKELEHMLWKSEDTGVGKVSKVRYILHS